MWHSELWEARKQKGLSNQRHPASSLPQQLCGSTHVYLASLNLVKIKLSQNYGEDGGKDEVQCLTHSQRPQPGSGTPQEGQNLPIWMVLCFPKSFCRMRASVFGGDFWRCVYLWVTRLKWNDNSESREELPGFRWSCTLCFSVFLFAIFYILMFPITRCWRKKKDKNSKHY